MAKPAPCGELGSAAGVSRLMARKIRNWNPGDAANQFIRVVLSDAGTLLGGLSDEEWKRTLAWFGGRCAYTGTDLVDGQMDQDHAIPMNRKYCGLHLFGNVVPATREANQRKGGTHYREFVEDRALLERIEAFVADAGYWDRVSVFGNLQHYCEAQYRTIDALCRINKTYLKSLLPEEVEDDGVEDPRPVASLSPRGQGGTLPITLIPASPGAFKQALLRQKCAWIIEVYQDGREQTRRWNARNMSETSNVIGNLRSRADYRAGAWRRNGIVCLRVSIQRP